MTPKKISILFVFIFATTISATFIILYERLHYGKNASLKHDNTTVLKQDDRTHFLRKLYTRNELNNIFEREISDDEMKEIFGVPTLIQDGLSESEDQASGEKTKIYSYIYDNDLLQYSDKGKNGLGFFVIYINEKPVNWDILGLDIHSSYVTKNFLDKYIHHGMSMQNVYQLLGEPRNIYRNGNSQEFTYLFLPDSIPKDNKISAIGIYIYFIDKKVANWGTISSHANDSALLYKILSQ